MWYNIWVSACLLFSTTVHWMMKFPSYHWLSWHTVLLRGNFRLSIMRSHLIWLSMCPYHHCVHTRRHCGDSAPAGATGWNLTTWLNIVIKSSVLLSSYTIKFDSLNWDLYTHTPLNIHTLLFPGTFPRPHLEEQKTNGSFHSAECWMASRCDRCSVARRSYCLE